MNYYYLFFGVFGFYYVLATIYLIYTKDKTNKLMKREHPHYSGEFTSSSDSYRIMRVYFTSKKLTKEEKSFLKIHVIIFIIFHLFWLLMVAIMFKVALQ